ncbi:MAG: HisA/HisF-related TIM barrel protein [Anaerolineaceae bacterium]|nr:HisA/HisF-related TIM barrel protein [Anaerolineaceae bacterium]
MRIIPVIDLKASIVVHAVKGEREQYRPLQSVLCDSPQPMDVANSFREKLGLAEFYIADLDAIQGRGDNKKVISSLINQPRAEILLDAGAGDAETIQSLMDLGVKKVIVGAETLPSLDHLSTLLSAFSPDRLIFSLDMQAGKILSRCSDLANMQPLVVLEMLESAGWLEIILLDLARIGTGAGIDRKLVAEAHRLFPEMSLIVGGGISQAGELQFLETNGVSGVLVATALHNGMITRPQINELSRSHR